MKQVTGKTRFFFHNWCKLTKNRFILNLVRGIRLIFLSPPAQIQPPRPILFSHEETLCIDKEVESMLTKGAIIPVKHTKKQFVSNIFTRPKKTGGLRPIINLKGLNKHLKRIHFKMEHLLTILPLVRKAAFMTSLDLKDAYFSLPIARKFRKYLRFQWRNQLYQFVCLCFGLSLAPFFFTKVMKPVFSRLRHEGINCTYYIDDSLYLNTSPLDLIEETEHAKKFLENLGFTVNQQKSSFLPSKRLTHLGFIIDTENYTVSLPQEKILKIEKECKHLLRKCMVSIREFAKVIGILVSSCLGVRFGQLHTRYLEIYKTQQLRRLQSYDANVYLSKNVRSELHWWVTMVKQQNGRIITNILGLNEWQFEIFTDASQLGWGATLYRGGHLLFQTGGRWSPSENFKHINYLELQAIQFSLFSFQTHIKGHFLRLHCDNTTAISYINKFGGCRNPSLNYLSRKIWLWCIDNNVSLNGVHIPGTENILADRLSRNFIDNIEWSLDDTVFAEICETFGLPDIDLFASRLNRKLPKYYSWRPDPSCSGVNAFLQSWESIFGYAFPPFNQISKVLHKLPKHPSSSIILVCPYWPSQPWFPAVSEFLIDRPLLLPSLPSLLRCPGKPEETHPLLPGLQLVVCKLSANNYLQRKFRQKHLKSSRPAGNRIRRKTTHPLFASGYYFVLNGATIPIGPL